MSVCTFDTHELANLAAFIGNARRYSGQSEESRVEELKDVCGNLALVSKANAACYNDRYSHIATVAADPALGSTAEEIFDAVARAPRPDVKRAVSTARLLRYNCVDGGGDFTLKVEGAAVALQEVLCDVVAALAEKANLS